MKKGVVVFCFLVALSFISAESVGNNIPIQIQTVDASGNVITGTFAFTINISNSASCTPVLYSNTTTKTTDSRGIVSYNLENVNLAFDEQYWFCYYRDGILKDTVKAARVPYTFRAKNVTLSGVDIDTNLVMGIYNITAGIGDFGAGLSVSGYRLNVAGNVNITGNISVGGNYLCNATSCFSFTDLNTSGTSGGSGVPAGAIMAFNQASCPTGWTLADGTSGTPDLRGIFIRGSGTSGVLKMANGTNFSAGFGTYGNDSFQGHLHLVQGVMDTGGSNYRTAQTAVGNTLNTYIGRTENYQSDGTNGVPRTGVETRPAYYATIYCVKTAEDTPVSNTIWGASGDNVFVQNTSLNVGIGTASPSAKLHISSIPNDAPGSGDIKTDWYGFRSSVSGTDALTIDVYYVGTGWDSIMAFDAFSHNVGIGTTAPAALLDIGTPSSSMALPATSGSTNTALFRIGYYDHTWAGVELDMGVYNGGGYPAWIQSRAPTNYSVNRDLLINPNGGNVGIGTTSPTHKLNVNGNTNITGTTTSGTYNTFTGSQAGAVTATFYTAFTASGTNGQMWIVSSYISGSDSPSGYHIVDLVMVANNAMRVVNLATATNMASQVSGLNYQIRQSSGVSQTLQWVAVKIG